jgi:hypothetical protein
MNQLINSKYGIDDNLDSTIPDDTGATPTKEAGSMGTADWIGIGMQVAGALANSQEEEKAKELANSRYNQNRSDTMRSSGLQRRDLLQQNATENIARTRGQNQTGLSYMTGLVSGNMQRGRTQKIPSFMDGIMNTGSL